MANERKTEIITREHFSKFLDSIYIEEQRSDNPKIDKLLKTASKKGGGKGYPEFIISYKSNPDLLIVIECKADVTKHESKDRDKYSEFTVNGSLLYASYLSKGFDVLAIAVSGETKQSLKVSHFLHLRDEKKATPIFGDKFLSVDDYLNGYLKSPEKFRQDYNSLLDFTKQLNEKLHTYKILESQRSLLISSILIALENTAFKRSYASHKKAENLAVSLIQTVSDELESANITGKKLENLNTQFSFIKTDTSLSKKENVLKEIIDEIDENINAFIKTHRYFDVLGQLYIEFLRYANSDKGLGIVLTPPHITELFADLAQVNKNSIAYDNCTGTGGFLISAMKRMITDAKGDETQIKEIKLKQLIGTEYQSHIFALAVSNMYIHQDGKTNIINGSCFDEEVIEEVKAKKPTVGFLNPPYQSKPTDTDELEFILNNLDCLVDGGTCIAIVPMQKALATSGNVLELKKKLLEKHTLQAVLSMPDELFHDSNVNVVSCVMIFTAHKPHPKTKETYFGYYKDDGYVKRKNKGRVDAYGKWEIFDKNRNLIGGIKQKWLTYFIDKNKKEEAGFSVNKSVSADMEWVAEAYMETNYSDLKDENFIDIVLKYLSFSVFQGRFDVMEPFMKENKKINLSINHWKLFKLKDLFKIFLGKPLHKTEILEYSPTILKDYFPYITRTTQNNATELYIPHKEIYNKYVNKGNAICIGAEGFQAFYQKDNFITGNKINIMGNEKLNLLTSLFLSTVLNLEIKNKFSYGRGLVKSRLENLSIKLPTKNNQPDWEFMENYIKSLSYSITL
ncbi:MAG: N-6 DNA methylase [Patescibacteria group bacterium]